MAGLFGRLFGRKRIDSSHALYKLIMGQGTSKAGASVTLDSALRVSTVLACGRVISEGVAQTPFKLFEPDGKGRQIVRDSPVHNLFAQAPNDWMTPFELFEQMALHLVLTGNAFCFKTLTNSGDILELLPLQPQWVTITQEPDWTLRYKVKFPGKLAEDVPAANIWHVRGPGWASYTGFDMVGLARDAIGLAIATEEFGSKLFSNGARPGGILTTDDTLSEEKTAALLASWKEANEGSGNAMRTAILSGGLKFQQLSMTADDAQFLDTRKLAVEEVCRFMRVLPIMIGHSGDKNATYASAEQMFLAHVVHTLMPWFVRIEQSAAKNLLTPAQRKAGQYFKFLPNGLLRGAAKDRAEYYAKALGSGGAHAAWMTQDEVRGLEELNPLGGAAAALPVMTGAPAPQ